MRRLLLILLLLGLAACDDFATPAPSRGSGGSGNSGNTNDAEFAQVIRVIDGDTIAVNINGQEDRVRYVGVNTPEDDEACYSEATQANAALVQGQTVRLVRDRTNRDRFDRLLRYVYVGDVLVNRELIVGGYGEAVLYEPDDRFFAEFSALEQQAALSSRGCHPTGIFSDNDTER